MGDRSYINAILPHSQAPHNERAQVSNFSKLQNNLKPYTSKTNKLPDLDSQRPFPNTSIKAARLSSPLSLIVGNSTILAKIESRPYLRSAILSNPSLVDLITNNPELLSAIIKSPGLLTSLTSNPELLSSIKDNPALLAEIIKNPNSSIKSILESFTKKTETNPPTNTKNDQPQSPHPLDKSTIASEKARPAAPTTSNTSEVQKPQTPQIIQTKGSEAKALEIKAPMAPISKPMTSFDAKSLTANSSLFSLLGSAALTSYRGRLVPVSGDLKDVGVELETQSESQPDAIQESDQVNGIGEIGEIHSVAETSI